MVRWQAVKQLQDEVQRLIDKVLSLEEGACRFHCRTAKENWLQGYIEAQHNAARGARLDAIEAWNEVQNHERERRQTKST